MNLQVITSLGHPPIRKAKQQGNRICRDALLSLYSVIQRLFIWFMFPLKKHSAAAMLASSSISTVLILSAILDFVFRRKCLFDLVTF